MALCSIALAAGIVGVVALVKGALWRRRFGHLAYHGGRGCRGGHARRWWRGGGGGGPIGGSFWLRALYARLDTTPGQEREIRAVLEELRDRARSAKESDVPDVRANIGKALLGESFDESAFAAMSARIDATGEKMKDAFGAALKRIHTALDPKQRERLAELITRGFGPWRGVRGSTAYRGDVV